MRLKDKTAIVTGASQGIGRSITETFVKEGAKVIALDISELPYSSEGVFGYQVNVTNRNEVSEFFGKVISEHGNIDILINNAGITKDALTEKMTEDQWDLVIDVNLKGVFNVTQLVGPHMVANGQGSIVNIASVVGEYGNVGQANYAATKAGVIGMAKSWAKEFARKGANVRVNSIAPGYINTDMMKTVPENVLEKIRAKTMVNRLGEPQEIANAVLFLASDEASYITGHNLSVNGGMRL